MKYEELEQRIRLRIKTRIRKGVFFGIPYRHMMI